MIIVFMGPTRSMWTNSNGLEVVTMLIGLKPLLVCFPSWYKLYLSKKSSLGIPLTSSLEEIIFNSFMLACPSLLYQLTYHVNCDVTRNMKRWKHKILERYINELHWLLTNESNILDERDLDSNRIVKTNACVSICTILVQVLKIYIHTNTKDSRD